MKRITAFGLALLFIASVSGPVQAGWNPNAEKEAQEAIAEFNKADPGMKIFFEKAYGYAVFPTVGKGAIVVGGAHGSGIVYEKGKAIGKTTLSQGTIGLQVGGQAYREIIFFENKATIDNFKAGNLELSAQVSAVAVKAGASADAAYKDGVAVFTMAKGGLILEASIGGQKFSYEPKE